MHEEAFKELVEKVRTGEASPDDYRRLAAAVKDDESGTLASQIDMSLQSDGQPYHFDEEKWMRAADGILGADKVPVRRMHVMRRWGWAAACIILLISAGIYWWPSQQPAEQVAVTVADVTPGSNKAILTLADGTQISLDSNASRMIREGIRQEGNQLQYDGAAGVSLNTLSTPRGGQFQVKLPDGTMAWLNAASSIRYPAAFIGKERVVEITGEVYFEVAKNAKMPFRVKAGNRQVIEVLGTHFNVCAYNDETIARTTLIEGAVRVQGMLLKPGQQAQTGTDGTKIMQVHTDQAIAWKNGFFDFEDADLEDVMRQLSRWYDLEVIYEGKPPRMQFGGKMSRDLKLSDILAGLKGASVHFRIDEGRKLIVLP